VEKRADGAVNLKEPDYPFTKGFSRGKLQRFLLCQRRVEMGPKTLSPALAGCEIPRAMNPAIRMITPFSKNLRLPIAVY
jgi:hypothetical protein